MKRTFNTLISFGLFLNLYIILTYFWDISSKLYQFTDLYSFILNLVPFIASLLIVLRHAQIIEITFDISKQSEYTLAVLGLSLPLITVLLQKNISIILIGYLLVSLVLFEIFLLKPKGERVNLWCKSIIGISWLILFLQNRGQVAFLQAIQPEFFTTIIIAILAVIIFFELYITCISLPPHVSDRYDLYMLAYFSVAGVLFNYCSEHIAKTKIDNFSVFNIPFPEIVLFIFWVVVLVRIIQSLHLAALDYQDTQLKGLDLAVLSIFYIFITTYWLLHPEQIILYGVLCVLAFLTSCYFAYMRFVRIKNETTINLSFDNRIQSVNSIVFAIVALSNGYMYFTGYNHFLFFIQIILLLFNIFHSYGLTMWVKFDLLFNENENDISLKPVGKEDLKKVTSIINHNFGYIYSFSFNTIDSKKKTRRLIYLLLSSGSKFGAFGMSHFFWIVDKKRNKNIGLLSLRAKHNNSAFYAFVSLVAFLPKYLYMLGLIGGLASMKSLLNNKKYIDAIDLSNDSETVELSYIVINKVERRKGLTGLIIETLKNMNKQSEKLYPKKHQKFRNVTLIARKTNDIAISSFERNGFFNVKEIESTEFDIITGKGNAIVMQCPIKEARIFE